MSRRSMRKRLAELDAPLPPVADTLAVLEALETHQYETKARSRAAIKLAHRALRDLLAHIQSSSQHEDLISGVTAESLHRRLRSSLELDKPKRFPSLPRALTPRVVVAAATPPPAALATEPVGAEDLALDHQEPRP